MKITQSFVKKNCPCIKNHPCEKRGAECAASCPEWAEWERKREEERKRIQLSIEAEKYVAAGASATISRSVHFRAMKRERGIK